MAKKGDEVSLNRIRLIEEKMLELSLKEKDKYYAESLITPRFFLKKSPRHHEMSEDERLAYTMQRIINYID